MTILNRFGTQTLSINIADNIQSGTAGVMGDFNSRGLNVTILAENGEKLEDPEVGIKLLCKTEDGAELIFTKGEYKGGGIYSVDYPNEIFEKEQEISCIIQLTVEEEIIYSRIFKRRVAKGLLGTEREGTSTIIDLLKIMDFADNYEEKLKEMEDLGNKEEAEIIDRAKWLTKEFDNNAADTYLEYDNNAEKKTDAFNANATEKTEIVNNLKTEVEELKNITVAAKDTTLDTKEKFDGEYTDFNNRYTDIQGILEAEEDRVEAENARQDFDERLQKIFDEGLDSELGNYYTKPETDAELSKKANKNQIDWTFPEVVDVPTPEYDYAVVVEIIKEHAPGNRCFLKMIDLESDIVSFDIWFDYGSLNIRKAECTLPGRFWYRYKDEQTLQIISKRGRAKFNHTKDFYLLDARKTLFSRGRKIEVKQINGVVLETLPEDAVSFGELDKTKTELRALRTDLEEESDSNREEFSKINAALEAHSKILTEILEVARDTNSKIDDSNRNYKALLESDKDLIG